MSWLSSMHLPRLRLPKTTFLWSFLLSLRFAEAQNLTDGQIDVISTRLAESALESWEIGTRAQTILELNATEYSVFSSTSLPPPSSVPSSLSSSGVLTPFFTIAHDVVVNRTKANNGTTGPQPLIFADGAAADPASIGVCDSGQVDYAGAATDQLNYLLQDVPRTSDGAISHRVSQVQLWSDFVYMVPPFLAYYGVTTRNRTLVEEAYNQIKLYRNYLRDPNSSMWRHVILGASDNDEDSGNGWAAAGMLRVLATMRQSEYANTFKNEQKDLSTWVQEIHAGVYKHLDNTNVFTNYADQPPTAQGNFYDASSTSLLTSTVYRAALLLNQHTYLPFAERSRQTLFSTNSTSDITSNSSSSLQGYQHLTPEGWLTPVVNPHSYGLKGNISAEGQAFVIQLHAAYREWVQAGSKGASAALSVRTAGQMLKVMFAVGTVLGLVGVVV
ncbi:Six-hairpin glycosidase-like protein [Gymnopilus junonius]|uniref:Six-hairpin glycosidase-like protein n=1 Tax=Gymnopilus junonius TaxID=109634 RepID=A0A9P5NEG0_GYMJU|nr:Six-hairpin glycosidase-like protein [Gymnopilus junonius]